jgi:uncharacterized membrane protein
MDDLQENLDVFLFVAGAQLAKKIMQTKNIVKQFLRKKGIQIYALMRVGYIIFPESLYFF